MTTPAMLVTGGASGIGAATVRALEEAGRTVISWDLAWDSPSPGRVEVDISNEDAVQTAAAALPSQLSAVINCAGIGSRGEFTHISPSEFRRVVDVNLNGTAAIARAAYPRLSGGVFIAVGSVAATVPMARRAVYCASKAAVLMLSKVLASEWAAANIQVLCVSPGFVDTGMAVRGAEEGATSTDEIFARTPTKALVPVQDLVRVLVTAATGGLPAVTGSEIIVDSGYTAGTRV